VNPAQDSLAGLIAYLREYIPEFLSHAGLHGRLDFPSPAPDYPLPAEARRHLFLLVKEALNNVVKHAGAKEVRVRIQIESGRLLLSIEDDGRGFASAGQGQNFENGNGLPGMRRRAEMLGGKLDLRTEPGRGVKITVTMPLPARP
jgi:signal transduction histidine kinase